MSEMKKRWIALYVENDVGVLAKVSGLFSGILQFTVTDGWYDGR